MIPIDVSKPYRHTDDKSGVVYLFRFVQQQDSEECYNILGMLANVDKKKNAAEEIQKVISEYYSKLINFFLVGWEGKNLPEFPKDNDPQRFFFGSHRTQMINTVNGLLNTLIGITDDEAKNSLRQPAARGKVCRTTAGRAQSATKKHAVAKEQELKV